ncbi:MAG TPA: hypothetical protein VNL17_14470 [Verrucomicrobiae bacterium]|nr:hypothetical protein [Verrucomicrobiae bacterium]
MTAENIRTAHGLWDNLAFREFLDAFVEEEMSARLQRLRISVQDGQPVAAALIEGEIAALESLPKIFKKHASKYQPA